MRVLLCTDSNGSPPPATLPPRHPPPRPALQPPMDSRPTSGPLRFVPYLVAKELLKHKKSGHNSILLQISSGFR